VEEERGDPDGSMTEDQLRAVTIGELVPLSAPIRLFEYDPDWPDRFRREAERIRAVLGDRVLQLEHVGSTAVPGLHAKPIIDMLLVLANSADEPAYVPAMEGAGYVLRIREPDWNEHRLFKGPESNINLHVFSTGCPEVARMLAFRDWLRINSSDRDLYARTKLELARKNWMYVQNYADAKTVVVEQIMARARNGV
jgi:GrpB-like predicted nucleotidyltransferase (UPF0157 family)